MKENSSDASIALFKEKCRDSNLKITPQRTTIYRELSAAKDHPTADMLYKRVRKVFPNISFDTVYRTLSSFSEIGLADVVEGYGEPKRFDPDIRSHQHFRCLACGSITDFHSELYENLGTPKEIEKEFKVTRKRVILEGFCKNCRKK